MSDKHVKNYSDDLLDGVADPKAEIPGVDPEKAEAMLRATTSAHKRGHDDKGRLTIDGVPVEREPLANPELSENAEKTFDAQRDGNALDRAVDRAAHVRRKSDLALQASLKVAGIEDPSLAGIGQPGERDAELPTPLVGGKKIDAESSGKVPMGKPEWARSHHSKARDDYRQGIAAERDPSVQPPRQR